MAKKSGGDNSFPNGEAFFPEEHAHRTRLPSGSDDYPRPHFVQPDTGVHTGGKNPITVETNPTSSPSQSSEPEDLDGGYY